MPMNELEHSCWTKLIASAARGAKLNPLHLLGLTTSDDAEVAELANMITDLVEAYDSVKPPAPKKAEAPAA